MCSLDIGLVLNEFSRLFEICSRFALNPFQANAPFQYPPKAADNRKFSDVFRECRREHKPEIDSKCAADLNLNIKLNSP